MLHILAELISELNLKPRTQRRMHIHNSTLQAICRQFDKQSDVAIGTHAHSTRTDKDDVAKVPSAVLKMRLLEIKPGRAHSAYRHMKLNPLWKWNREDTKKRIEMKKDFMKYEGAENGRRDNSDSEDEYSSDR